MVYPIENPGPVKSAIAQSRKRGAQIVAEMKMADGGAWSGAQLSKQFGLSGVELRRRREEHRIVFWREGKRTIRYPRWQFTKDGALLAGIEELLQIFRSRDQWRLMCYFLAPRLQLNDRRPLDLFRTGAVATVLNHARRHADENTW